MTSKILTLSILASSALLTTATFAEEITLDPIVVSSDFREKKLSQTSASVSVVGTEEVYDKASQNFSEIIGSQANVNFSSGASKSKSIQIRGIGERGQFETPINPSVGIMIDGIDFSNIALGVSMFDVQQIELLRGPQGTTFGANGLAGVVNVESNEPTEELEGHLEATVGNYNTKALGAALSGSLIKDTLEGRVSIYKNKSDGYMQNSFLNRTDTNNIDELYIKTQLRWYATDNHTIDFNYIHANVNNGYDSFTLDNSRNSHADQPGRDTQKTDAFSLKSTYQIDRKMHLVSSVSYSTTSSEYSYDEDWTYVGEYAGGYSSFDQYLRKKKQADIDVRLVSDEDGRLFSNTTDWTLGAYYKKYSSDLTRNNTYFLVPFDSAYNTKNLAIYGQLDSHINDKLTFISGLRVEQWKSKYNDNDTGASSKDKTLIGGKVGLTYESSNNALYYVTLARGYKPGGINPVTTASGLPKEFSTEALWNLDVGMNSKHLDGKLLNRLNLFYGKRIDQQVTTSQKKVRPDNSIRYSEYISNANHGTYYGIESTLDYYPNESLHIFSSVGLLQSEVKDYVNPVTGDTSLSGRTPAQSPEYQYNIGFDVTFADGWIFKTNVEGKGSYYFSNSFNQKSDAYHLINSSIEYTHGGWSVVVWGRNLADTDYATRGYFFGNDPSIGYADTLYTQKGTPRTFGLTLSYDF